MLSGMPSPAKPSQVATFSSATKRKTKTARKQQKGSPTTLTAIEKSTPITKKRALALKKMGDVSTPVNNKAPVRRTGRRAKVRLSTFANCGFGSF